MQFLQAFPEAASFSVTLLTDEKRAVVHQAQCSAQNLHKNLPVWLGMKNVHFFIRPHMANLVLVDLDNYTGEFQLLLRLQPRALVRTSPGNYQLWLSIPDSLVGKTASWVTKQLTQALKGDPASVNCTQQGRLPGSINVKPGKGMSVFLLSSQVQHMCEQTFLHLTPRMSVSAENGK